MLSRLQSVSVALSCLQVSGATWSDVWDARVGSGIAQFLTPADLARVSLVEKRTSHSQLLVHKFEPHGEFSWAELPAVLPYCKTLNLSHAKIRVTPPGSLTSLRFPDLVSLNLGLHVTGDVLSQETMGVFRSVQKLSIDSRFRGFLAPPGPGVPGVYPIAQVFPNLKSLTIWHSGSVTDWGFLAAYPNLEVLNIPEGTISDAQWHLLPLTLRKLEINQVSQPLPPLPFLESLFVADQWTLSDLASLRVLDMPSVLSTLVIDEAPGLTDIATLKYLSGLRTLKLGGLPDWNDVIAHQVKEAFSGLTQLESLSISVDNPELSAHFNGLDIIHGENLANLRELSLTSFSNTSSMQLLIDTARKLKSLTLFHMEGQELGYLDPHYLLELEDFTFQGFVFNVAAWNDRVNTNAQLKVAQLRETQLKEAQLKKAQLKKTQLGVHRDEQRQSKALRARAETNSAPAVRGGGGGGAVPAARRHGAGSTKRTGTI